MPPPHSRASRCLLHAAVVVCLTGAGRLHAQVLLVLQPGSSLSTMAGNGTDARTSAGDARLSALASPQAIAYDAAGNLYIADARNHQISRVNIDGQLSILAGTGRQGFAGDGGPATAAEWNLPSGIAVDAVGNVFIADTGNHRIRRISASDSTVTTVAGTGLPGFSGDAGLATAARLRSPTSLALDANGALYIADAGNHRVRKLNPDGKIFTVAGNGSEGQEGDGGPATSATLGAPSGLTILPDGQLLIADQAARRLRALQPDGSIAAYSVGAAVRSPRGLAAGANGSVYVADAAAQNITQSSMDGASLLAGNREQGHSVDGSPLATPLDTPVAVAVRPSGDIAFADAHNHKVQHVSLPFLNFGNVPAGDRSRPQTLTLQNGGEAAMTLLAMDLPAGFERLNDGSTCSTPPFNLQAAAQCKVAVLFAPKIQGAADATALVRVVGGAPRSLLLRGTGTAGGSLAGSVTALHSDGSIAYSGSPVTLTAMVSGSLLQSPAGNISFLDGANPIGSSQVASGSATLATSSLSTGAHSLHAKYSGDATYSSSTSPTLAVTVVPSPDFTLTASATSYSGKSSGTVIVPMTLLPVNGTLNRPVQFAVTGLPSGTLATFAPATLTLGGDTAAVTLTLQVPATLSSNSTQPWPPFAELACALLVGGFLTRRKAVPGFLAVGLFGICLTGCGSGFRATTTAANQPGTAHTYTGVVTATTTGVLGTPLAHSTSIGLVITQ